MFSGFSHVMLYVTDLERAVRWYTEVLGCSARFVIPNAYASLEFKEFGMRLDLHPTEASGKDVGFGPVPYFSVKNIEATLELLKQRGVRVSEVTQHGESPKFASFWDSEGNTLGLEEH